MNPGASPAAKAPLRSILPISLPSIEICDIGAMAEGQERFANLVAQGGANVNGFEPNPAELAKLEGLKRPNRKYHPYFLGDGRPATFYITRYPGCCSLYEPNPEVIDLFTSIGTAAPGGNFLVLRTEPVQTTRLDDVPNLPPVIDYLKLDIQGAELDVLKAGTRTLADAVVVETEVEFAPLYKNQPLFGDIQVFLREQGFALHKFIDVAGRAFRPIALGDNPFAPISQLLWADAVFVRDFSRLDRYGDEQLLKAAVILYDVYNSFDLVHVLLTKYDQRRATKLATAFHEAMSRQPNLQLMFMNPKLHS